MLSNTKRMFLDQTHILKKERIVHLHTSVHDKVSGGILKLVNAINSYGGFKNLRLDIN